MQSELELVARYSANNYHPLPVVLIRGEGAYVWDENGKKYLDCLSAYSALNHGHRHPKIIAAMVDQLSRVTLTSRAFHHDQLGAFLKKLCELTGYERALPMNSGAEAVETAIKAARKWGIRLKRSNLTGPRLLFAETIFMDGRPRSLVFDRTSVPRRLRPVYSGIQGNPLWRRCGSSCGDHAQYGRIFVRTHPGRGRSIVAGRWIFERGAENLHGKPSSLYAGRDPNGARSDGSIVCLRARERGRPSGCSRDWKGLGRRSLSCLGNALRQGSDVSFQTGRSWFNIWW